VNLWGSPRVNDPGMDCIEEKRRKLCQVHSLWVRAVAVKITGAFGNTCGISVLFTTVFRQCLYSENYLVDSFST